VRRDLPAGAGPTPRPKAGLTFLRCVDAKEADPLARHLQSVAVDHLRRAGDAMDTSRLDAVTAKHQKDERLNKDSLHWLYDPQS
jgi:hypothetical protein